MNSCNIKIAELSNRLEHLVDRTFKLLDSTNSLDIKKRLIADLDDLKNRIELKIAFVGQYSSGKSTIISALTGNKEIKIDANIATDIVSEYKWNNVVLVDTPGILAGKIEQHDQRTKAALKECDLIVYVLTSQLFDDVIFNNFIDLAYTQKLNDKMLLVINKMSMDAGDFETLSENYINSIKNIFDERGYEFYFDIVFMDAADFIEGNEDNDDEFIKLSNFNSFINTLNRFVDEKGIIKKQFDTPIRILKSSVSDIAVSQVDIHLKSIFEQYSQRIKKSMKDIERSVFLNLIDFQEKVIALSIDVSAKIGEISDKDFESEIEKLSDLLKVQLTSVIKKIEDVTNEEYSNLMDSMDEFERKDTILLFTKNLETQINMPTISQEERINLEKQRTILSFLSKGGQKATELSSNGINGLNGLAQASGSQMHNIVTSIGKFFGHKFKPWEAVKTASNIGKFAKVGIPIATTMISIGLDFYEKDQEEKRIKKIAAAKNQFNAKIRERVKELRENIENEFNSNVLMNYKEKLSEIDKMKLDIVNTMTKNENMKKYIMELDSEYVDFIEIIENKVIF